MCNKPLKYMATILLFCCLPGVANSDDLDLARERLQAKMDQDKKSCVKGRLISLAPGPWTPVISKACEEQKNLTDLVERTPTDELPDILINIFIDEYTAGPSKGKYPPMRNYLEIFGEPAAAPLMKRYEEIGEDDRQYAIRLLGEIGSDKALPFIRSELKKKNISTLESAAYAIRMIRNEEAKEDLLPFLWDPELDPVALPMIVRQLSNLNDPGWFDIVLNLAEEGKIDFQTITDLGSFKKYPESVVAAHLAYLLDQWGTGNAGTAACLLLQIHERRILKRLFPVLDDLIRADFWYAGTSYTSLRSNCSFSSRSNRPLLLVRIEDTLIKEDIVEWMQQPSPGWLTYLYLHDLYLKKGGPPLDTSEMVLNLSISVFDDAGNDLLGRISEKFISGVRRDIVLELKDSNEVSYRCSFTPRLYREIGQQGSWIIYLNDFRIAKPVLRYGDTVRISVGSKAHFKTADSDGRVARWEVMHIGPPPAEQTAHHLKNASEAQ